MRYFCQVAFLTLFRGRVFNVTNVPREGGALLVCNHQSFLDPVLSALALPRECHFMARDTLFKNDSFRWLIDSLNAFPVKRGAGDIGAIKETLRRLKNGGIITVFPEGTRTLDGSLQPMRSGVIMVARKAKVPIVPMLILGAYEAWPRTAKLPTPLSPVIVAYGTPIPPEVTIKLDENACLELVSKQMHELMARYQHHPLLTENR